MSSQDDIIDDVESFVAAAEILKERGAYKIFVMATHGLLSADAPRLIEESSIDEVGLLSDLGSGGWIDVEHQNPRSDQFCVHEEDTSNLTLDNKCQLLQSSRTPQPVWRWLLWSW